MDGLAALQISASTAPRYWGSCVSWGCQAAETEGAREPSGARLTGSVARTTATPGCPSRGRGRNVRLAGQLTYIRCGERGKLGDRGGRNSAFQRRDNCLGGAVASPLVRRGGLVVKPGGAFEGARKVSGLFFVHARDGTASELRLSSAHTSVTYMRNTITQATCETDRRQRPGCKGILRTPESIGRARACAAGTLELEEAPRG